MKKRVLLCGNSLFVSGLEASLVIEPELTIQQVGPQIDVIHDRVKLWKPDVLILETTLLKEKVSMSILDDFPRMRIISVDLDQNRLLVLSGLASESPSTEDLLQIIAA